MPSTFNGIGTWYWGKRNLRRVTGTCEACGSFGELSSYDTTLYFVIFFLPIIPLRRKRIVRQCPRCTRHRAVPLGEWEAGKREAAERATAALRDSAAPPSAFAQIVADLVAFEDEDAFTTLAGRARDRIAGDAKALAAFGAGYASFGRAAEAEAAYRASLAVNDDPRVRETLAGNLIVQGRPDEAAPLLRHVIAEKREEKVGDLYVLAMGYQAKGMHREAFALLDGIAAAFPGAESEAEFRRLRKISVKHEATGKPVKSPLVAPTRTDRRRRAVSPKVWAFAGSAVVVAALAIYLAVAWWGGRSRKVWLVNGLGRAYEVSVAGATHELPPMSHGKIELAEGEIAVKVLDGKLGIPEETCRIETPFFSRPFLERTYVINPDRVALITRERAIYTVGPAVDSPPPRILVGRLLYEFKGIDYEFRSFPRTIMMEGRRLSKERVGRFRGGPEECILAITESGRGRGLIAYLKRNAGYDPRNEVWLYALFNHMQPAEFIEFANPRLGDRPVLADWHRMYQVAADLMRDERDLEAEYRALLAREPDDPALLYLVGRVVDDREEARRLFRAAAAGETPCAHALYELAHDTLGQGRFDEALDLADRAAGALPGRADFTYVRELALLGAGRTDDLLARIRRRRQEAPLDAGLASAETGLLASTGDDAGARKVIDKYCSRLAREGDPDLVAAWRGVLHALKCYASGDAAGYLEKMAPAAKDEPAFAFLLTAGRLAEAAEAVAKLGRGDHLSAHLTTYLAASDAGRADLAAEQLGAATDILRAGTSEDRGAADLLSGDRPPSEDEAYDLLLDPGVKCLVLATLGVRFPSERELYWPLARRLNFDPAFPHLLIEKALGRPPEPTSM